MSDNEKAQDRWEGLDTATVQFVLKETKDLIRSLEGTATSRVQVTAGTLQIVVEREGGVIMSPGTPTISSAPVLSLPGGGPGVTPGLMPVVSPLVGVFYTSSSPGSKAFIEVGDTVEPGQTVGIVEAMKVMNEVISDYRGVVKEILVANGQAVQFEQPLILIDTTGKVAE